MYKVITILIISVVLSGCNMKRGVTMGGWSLCNYPYPYVYGADDTCDRIMEQACKYDPYSSNKCKEILVQENHKE